MQWPKVLEKTSILGASIFFKCSLGQLRWPSFPKLEILYFGSQTFENVKIQVQYSKLKHEKSILFLSQDFTNVKTSVFNVYKR